MGRVACGSAGLLALALLAACSGSGAGGAGSKPVAMAGGARGASVGFSPADKAAGVPTDQTVLVSAHGGKLKSVQVDGGKAGSLDGVLSADGTRWRSVGTARPGAAYTVTAVAVDAAGKESESRSTFSTVKGGKTFDIENLTPNRDDTGLTVGVGMPVMITFDQPIADRVAVERNLLIHSSKPVEGAWHWFDSTHVDFRPQTYWPAHTKVRVEANLAGVRGGPGMHGKRDVKLDFKIGRSQITKGSTDDHVLTVRRDGKRIRTMLMSAGQGGQWKYYTTSGVHLAMSREPVTVMVSPGIGPGSAGYYRLTVYNTVRISNSGEYVHSAPWSVGSQGNSNVSHGCVNISPGNAAWFIKNTLIGDPIIITGSPRKLEPTNGWGHWQENWKQWLKWSSLKASPTITLP
ncbi:Lipoprotein-anchoring transpeptidase ErfK/SrfK [Nonomuraea solani]|uniref:Lipoprotein-anchoring transpeptidase ErfK/SrfK n=1 Tax=Nonomuraea solani TaxID=1144553 RepID=A0A1H6DI70_9ACTN|nr:Ig-like domain-containing protein [Nonomuraea solani]SEG84950.1 Lipoprotein-anchoring transpeptidase ErfK/SrfK [Nonomuraea solani]